MPNTTQKASAGGKKRTVVIIILALIIIVVGALAGYTFYQLHTMRSALQSGAEQSEALKKADPPPPPIYILLDSFTVSLQPGEKEGDRVLYIGLTLRLKDEPAAATLRQFLPEVRSRLLLLFSQQTAEALATDGGKVALRDNIKQVVNQPLADGQSVTVTDVLFNAFILR